MPNITLVTPPDKVLNHNKAILLIYPSESLKSEFQTVVQDWNISFNLYVYELKEHNLDWLLTMSKIVDYVIFDVDNSASEVRDLASYIIANPNTYWLTNSIDSVYNNISINRVYDLSFLKEGDMNGV
ncbi:MAG: hypothetical protein VW551_03950 [Euryarchaeota archaeon]|jgi:hypothetical protein